MTTHPTVEAFEKANKGMRPNFMAVGGYDGMRVIYEALKATKGTLYKYIKHVSSASLGCVTDL